MNDKYISNHPVPCGEDFAFRLTDSCPFSVEFPTLEEAVSKLCEQVFGATLKLVPDETGSEKCVDDGGDCGIGGYCPECPHGDRPTPLADRVGRLIHGFDEPEHREAVRRITSDVADLERQLAEARDENKKLVADLRLHESKSLRLCEELTEARSQRDEWKAKYIQQNKDLGCELRDPNGTIWDEAKRLKGEKERLAAALKNACAHPVCGDWWEEANQALEALKP